MITGLVALLLGTPSIASVVGSAIQPVPAPDNEADYPVITYQAVSYTTEYAFQAPTGVSKTRIVFDCFALRYLDASNLAQALKTTLSGYSGTLPDGTVVFLVEIVNIVDVYVPGSSTYKTSVHAMVQYSE